MCSIDKKYFGKDIHSYSIGFEGDSTSEHGIAEKTASIIGAKHSTQMLKKSELFAHSVSYIKTLTNQMVTGVVFRCICYANTPVLR